MNRYAAGFLIAGAAARAAGRGITAVEERELWNAPLMLLLLLGLLSAEWGYRRAVGLYA